MEQVISAAGTRSPGRLQVINDQIYSNRAGEDGGGVYSEEDLLMDQSTIEENSASDGAGFYVAAPPVYPVGYLFYSSESTDPSGILGYGTWARYGNGRVIVGVEPNDSDFNVGGKTGGGATHTLTIAEMPSHAHPQRGYYTQSASGTKELRSRQRLSGDPVDNYGADLAVGGGQAHNNLGPYTTVYQFQRVS